MVRGGRVCNGERWEGVNGERWEGEDGGRV